MAKKKLRAGEVQRTGNPRAAGATSTGPGASGGRVATSETSPAPVTPPRSANRVRAGQVTTPSRGSPSAASMSSKSSRSPRTPTPSSPSTSVKNELKESQPRVVEAVAIESYDSEDEFHDTDEVVIDSDSDSDDDNDEYDAVIETVSQPVLYKAKVVQNIEEEQSTPQTAQKAVSGIPTIKIYSPHNSQVEFSPRDEQEEIGEVKNNDLEENEVVKESGNDDIELESCDTTEPTNNGTEPEKEDRIESKNDTNVEPENKDDAESDTDKSEINSSVILNSPIPPPVAIPPPVLAYSSEEENRSKDRPTETKNDLDPVSQSVDVSQSAFTEEDEVDIAAEVAAAIYDSPTSGQGASESINVIDKQAKRTSKIRATHTTITDPIPDDSLLFSVCIVGFHHALGPQIEEWFGPEDYSHLWPNLPFQALSDGSHSREEDFSYFTLLFDEKNKSAPEAGGYSDGRPFNTHTVTTLFGIACNRQVRVTDALKQDSAVTRSTVQKCVVVICRKPVWGPMKDKLAVVTRAFFMQPTFDDKTIIRSLFDSLTHSLTLSKFNSDIASDVSIGMSLCELVSRLKQKLVVVFKALLLEQRVLFYASSTELLCTSQFSLVSLIPNLIDNLQDCGSPLLHSFEFGLSRATSLKTSDRQSLLKFMGLPLMVFGEGGMFSPYIPLQQLGDLNLARYYLVGSTNSLLLQQKKKFADVIVNMDDNTVEILSPSLKAPLSLSSHDKRWIDRVVQAVDKSSDYTAATSFHGNEDYVRLQFEDYLMGLLSAVKYDNFLASHGSAPPPEMLLKEVTGNPVKHFSLDWVHAWRKTLNYELFNNFTDGELFDIVEPRHIADAGITSKQKSPFSEVGKAWAGLFGKNGANAERNVNGDNDKSQTAVPSVATTVASGMGSSDTASLPSDTSVRTHKSSDSSWSIQQMSQKSTSWFSRFTAVPKEDSEEPKMAEPTKPQSETTLSGWGKWAVSKKAALFGEDNSQASTSNKTAEPGTETRVELKTEVEAGTASLSPK